MKTIKRLSFLLILIIITISFFSCDINNTVLGNKTKTGTLIINNFEDNSRSLDIEWKPEILVKTALYNIDGVGPDGRTFETINTEGKNPVEISDLREGAWTITVTSLNEDGVAIGEGVANVNIIAAKTVSTNIVVKEFTGEGTLSTTIKWPKAEVYQPYIILYLERTTGKQKTYEFSFEGNNGEVQISKELDAGYYITTLSIYDGPIEDPNNKITGVSGSTRIVQDNTTVGLFTFTEDDLNIFGEIEVSIEDGITVPFEVELSVDRETTWDDYPINLTATPNSEGDFTYYWYLDGEKIETSNTNQFTLETEELGLGKHFVGVVVSRNGVLASDSVKITKTEESYEDLTFNNIFLGSEEIQQIKTDLPELTDSDAGIIFLSPHVIDSPLSDEIAPYSYEIKMTKFWEVVKEIEIEEGVFATFVPLDSDFDSGSTIQLDIKVFNDGSYIDNISQNITMPGSGPAISWLDRTSLFSSSDYIRNVKTIGVRFLIVSSLPLTNTNGGPISESDFTVVGGYVSSIKVKDEDSQYSYEIIAKSNFSGPGDYLELPVYTTSNILVDGKRELGIREISTKHLKYLNISNLEYGNYLDMEDNILEDGYYEVRNPEFKISVDQGYTFAGWEDNIDVVSFKGIADSVWKGDIQFGESNTLPIPIIVSEDTPIVTKFYFDRYSQLENAGFLVLGPLGTEETVKLNFSEAIKSNDGSNLSNSNFYIEGATISNVTHDGDHAELVLTDFGKGVFSLELKDIVSSDGNKIIEGQKKIKGQIVKLKVDNEEDKGTVADCEGLYFAGDKVSVIVSPNSNYWVTKLNDPSGYYWGLTSPQLGEPYEFDITIGIDESDTYTIWPEYQQ